MTVDWSQASLTDTAEAIRRGVVKSREVLESCISRYREAGQQLGCFIELDEAAACRKADEADRLTRSGAPLGPLHGIPLAHKDMFYRQGRVSACGSRLHADTIASTTATVLKRLDEAGALEIGRLVMVEFALGPHGRNPNYPQCRNPWNTKYIPGGSSSGSGVAVAARMIHAALGSDTGGSIRGPASVSGIVGLMPTNGRVSRFGVMPLSHSLDSVGPLTRTIRDAARMLDVLAGSDPLDQNTIGLPPFTNYEAGLGEPAPRPRIGVARGYFDDGLHPDVALAIAAACEAFGRAGFDVRDVPIPRDLLSEIAELQPLVLKVEAAANHMQTMRTRQEDYDVEVAERIQAGYFISAADYVQALKTRGIYLREFVRATFADVDVLLAPTIQMPVPSIADTTGKRGKDYIDMVSALTDNTKVINYLGLPSVNVPCGFTSNGLPTGFQLIGRAFREEDILRVGYGYQKITDWHLKTPTFKN